MAPPPLHIQLPPTQELSDYNQNYILYWNYVGLELNRLTHSLASLNQTCPQAGPPNSARCLAILHLAIHDAFFSSLKANEAPPFTVYNTYLGSAAGVPILPVFPGPTSASRDARLAVAGAAITALSLLYATATSPSYSTRATDELKKQLDQAVTTSTITALDMGTPSYIYGANISKAINDYLGTKGPELTQAGYMPKDKRYYFNDEPTNPVRLVPKDINKTEPGDELKAVHVYHLPFYGNRAKHFAVQSNTHILADPPVGTATSTNASKAEYVDSVHDVIRMGGAPGLTTTLRTPAQNAAAHFWAYDGANLIGTPPRLYNQILRVVAWNRKPVGSASTSDATNADFARLFALANVAMADAGIFAWKEKYCWEFWRPLSGVRQEPTPLGDPFWLSLGAPDTNTNHIHFKPPFPSYPSGHATFGAACFQAARLYYGYTPNEPDDISFDFVSDELNGISREFLAAPFDHTRPLTDQPGTVRTKIVRHFDSLWECIFENAISRIWLGVHWRFDAAATADILVPASASAPAAPYQTLPDGTTAYKDPADIRYETMGPRADHPGQMFPVGGIPLGLGVAQDIFDAGMKGTPAAASNADAFAAVPVKELNDVPAGESNGEVVVMQE
jgi:vanadium chloroperoxidase